MKRNAIFLFVFFALILLVGCQSQNNNTAEGSEDRITQSGNNDSTGTRELNETSFVLKATVNGYEDSGRLSVEIIESDYAFGTYWVNVSDGTLCFDSMGNAIDRKQICAGDTIEITYGGQVAMSYPPQISAQQIVILK